MKRFRDLSIQRKLTALSMVICLTALVLAAAAAIGSDLVHFRRALVRELTTTARITGENCTAALTFRDPAAAVSGELKLVPVQGP